VSERTQPPGTAWFIVDKPARRHNIPFKFTSSVVEAGEEHSAGVKTYLNKENKRYETNQNTDVRSGRRGDGFCG
jgi:hypothetical protein